MSENINHKRRVFLFYDKNEFFEFVQSRTSYEKIAANSITVSDDPNLLACLNNRPSRTVPQNKVNLFLGQELKILVYDALNNFSVNAFAAIIGCLVGGGSLVMLLPRHMKYLERDNHAETNNEEEGIACLNRLVREFLQIQSSVKFDAKGPSSKSDFYDITRSRTKTAQTFFEQQSNAIEMIKRVSLGHANRPLMLIASRGRGKSAALGIAVADLIFEKNKDVLVTAPIKANLGIFYAHFDCRLQQLAAAHAPKKLITNALKNKVFFVPLDKLVLQNAIQKLLIVEEAGAIPVQILRKIAVISNRVIYSTTTDGYEGNGQGFKIRFKEFLELNFRQWKICQLTHPARYLTDDPIEKAVDKALLLSNESVTCDFDSVTAEEVEVRCISQEELNTNELLLRRIYNLLLTSHYQTRPSDLERLLSDRNIYVYVALYHKQVLSAALVLREGPLSEKECSAIDHGKLRLAGQLLPQSLVAHQGLQNAGRLTYWRIMRIATHFEFRNAFLATKVINTIKQDAIVRSIDVIGASFALHNTVTKFWYKQVFSCSRIGLKRDSSTGELSTEFLFLVNENNSTTKDIFDTVIKRFNDSFFLYLKSNYRLINSNILSQMITKQVIPRRFVDSKKETQKQIRKTSKINNNSYSETELTRYIEGARGYEMVEWHLFQFMKHYMTISETPFDNLTEGQLDLIFKKVFQQITWKQIITQQGYSGKKEASAELRRIFKLLHNAK